MKAKKIRFVLFFFILIILCTYLNYPKLAIIFSKLPETISNEVIGKTRVAFINNSPCGTCASGKFLLALKETKKEYKTIFIPSLSFTQNDTDNLKRTFSLEGTFLKSNTKIEKFKKKIIILTKAKNKLSNINLIVSPHKRIKKVNLF